MSRTPQKLTGSRAYREAWRAVNLLIRSDGSWSGRERDVCYRNAGDGTFVDTSYVTGLDSAGDGRGFVTLDLNGDGALDLVEASRTAPRIRVLENTVPAEAGLLLELRGAGRSNPDAIGAEAEMITSRGRKLLRLVQAGSGYLTQTSRRLHFALMPGEKAGSIAIRWPDGASQTLTAVPPNGAFRLSQGGNRFEPLVAAAPVPSVSPKPEPPAPLWLVEPIPAPSMRGLAGGRLTLLNFWASWCPPCREEIKEWTSEASLRRLAAAGLRVVVAVVDQDSGPRPQVPFTVLKPSANELTAWNLFHRHLFDRRRDIGLPASFLIDESGRVLKVYAGVTPAAQFAADVRTVPAARRSIPFAGRWLGGKPKRNPVELATALAESGLPAESARYFELALRNGNASREAINNYAGVLLETGDLARAEKLLLSALTRDASSEHQEDVLANLGSLRLRQGRNEDARKAFEKVLQKSPDDAMALNGLGSVLFAGNDLTGAQQRFAAAVRADPDHAGYRYNWASALAAAGEFHAALREFESVRDRQPESAALANNLGILYVETGAPAKGEAAFRRAMELAPRDPAGYVNLSTLYQKTGRLAQARQVLRDLLQAVPGHPQALRMLETLGR